MKAVLVRIAPWVLIGAGSTAAGGVWGLLAGCTLLLAEEWFTYLRDAEAMAGANDIALAARSADSEALHRKVDALEAQVKELATPERLQATRELLQQMRKAVPGLPRVG